MSKKKKKSDPNDFNTLSKKELIELVTKLTQSKALEETQKINTQVMKEIEEYQDDITESKKINKQFTIEVEDSQSQLSWFRRLSSEFIREVESGQAKLVELDKVEFEFVKEIEQSQERIIKYLEILDTFVLETEENQEKLNMLIKDIKINIDRLKTLEKSFQEIIFSENLNEVDNLTAEFKIKLLKIINELHKSIIKVE
jgi:hypothetical protein